LVKVSEIGTWLTECSPVEDVEDEVAEDVCGQLLVDQFVHAALPSTQDLGEAAEPTGVGHVRRVGDCHRLSLF